MTKANDAARWNLQDVAKHFKVDIRTAERLPIPRIQLRTEGRRKPILRFDPDDVFEYERTCRTRPKTKRAG